MVKWCQKGGLGPRLAGWSAMEDQTVRPRLKDLTGGSPFGTLTRSPPPGETGVGLDEREVLVALHARCI